MAGSWSPGIVVLPIAIYSGCYLGRPALTSLSAGPVRHSARPTLHRKETSPSFWVKSEHDLFLREELVETIEIASYY